MSAKNNLGYTNGCSLRHGLMMKVRLSSHYNITWRPSAAKRYSSTLSLTSTLVGVGGVSGQRHAPTALPPGMTLCPLYRRLGLPQGQCGWVRKILALLGFEARTVQPVCSRCTDWAIPTHRMINLGGMLKICLSKEAGWIAIATGPGPINAVNLNNAEHGAGIKVLRKWK